jgi:uncharacterized membrane protein YgdD (TMEM256/DUF423 family)
LPTGHFSGRIPPKAPLAHRRLPPENRNAEAACFAESICETAGMNHRIPLVAAGLLGAAGVGAGAFGAHALREFLLDRGTREIWETGVDYQLLHAVALLGTAAWLRAESAQAAIWRACWAVRCWIVGVPLFSGSLYLLASGAPSWVGPITPLGGLALIAGWMFLVGAAWGSGASARRP